MKIELKDWILVNEKDLEEFFISNIHAPYYGTPLCDYYLKKYMWDITKNYSGYAKVVLVNGKPRAAIHLNIVPFLTKYWGKLIGTLSHIVIANDVEKEDSFAMNMLVEDIIKEAKNRGMKFISLTISGKSIGLAHALENNGFRYTEGFLNMVGPTNYFREQFNVPDLIVRDPIEEDFNELEEVYLKVEFPSRFVADTGFNKIKAKKLYTHRFREVYKSNLGKIFIGEIEGKFAGALIAIIDDNLYRATGIKTNILSGMGIVVNPDFARRGIALNLIEKRQEYYKSVGVEYVNFGANFNNFPMIRGLSKLGLSYGSLDVVFHCWL